MQQPLPGRISHASASDSPTPFDTPDAKTHRTELERLVDEIRDASPPPRDPNLATSPDAQAGEKLFTKIGCVVCHVPTYKTLPPGTRINGGTYKVPKFLGNVVIHPYSDLLLHGVGTGDGIPQAAKPEYLDQSTANKFRTAPLWGLRFRQGPNARWRFPRYRSSGQAPRGTGNRSPPSVRATDTNREAATSTVPRLPLILPSHSSRLCSRNQLCEVKKRERFGVTKSSKFRDIARSDFA
jgi:di-heme oxidoreductase (putative peroxidase)